MTFIVGTYIVAVWADSHQRHLQLNSALPEGAWGNLFIYFLKKNVFLFIYLIYLFLAALGLCCCAQAFSSCGEPGLLFIVVRGLLIAVASLVAEHGL